MYVLCIRLLQIGSHMFLNVPSNYPLARAWLCCENCCVKGGSRSSSAMVKPRSGAVTGGLVGFTIHCFHMPVFHKPAVGLQMSVLIDRSKKNKDKSLALILIFKLLLEEKCLTWKWKSSYKFLISQVSL